MSRKLKSFAIERKWWLGLTLVLLAAVHGLVGHGSTNSVSSPVAAVQQAGFLPAAISDMNGGPLGDFFQGLPLVKYRNVGSCKAGKPGVLKSVLQRFGFDRPVFAQSCYDHYMMCDPPIDNPPCQGCGSCFAVENSMYADWEDGYMPGEGCCQDQICFNP